MISGCSPKSNACGLPCPITFERHWTLKLEEIGQRAVTKSRQLDRINFLHFLSHHEALGSHSPHGYFAEALLFLGVEVRSNSRQYQNMDAANKPQEFVNQGILPKM